MEERRLHSQLAAIESEVGGKRSAEATMKGGVSIIVLK
jgi:hypothetical protein